MALRIMLLTDVYPPLIGGVELQMQLLGHKLNQRGHSVCVVTAWQPGQAERDDDAGVQVYRIKGLASRLARFSTQPGRRHHPPFPDPGVVWSLRRVIDRFRPDVVHTYGWITYSGVVALVGKSIPLLLSVREYAYTCALRTMMRYGSQPCDGPAPAKCLDCALRFYGAPKGLAAALGVLSGRLLLRWKTRGIHSVSNYMQQNIRRDLFSADERGLPDVVIPSFHDREGETAVGDTGDLQAFLARLPEQPFILFVGALRLVKGLRPLLAAYQRLAAPPPLVLLGRAAADTPSEFPANVTVLYDVPNRAVLAAWRRALFGVAPSTWPEPFGNVVREAMSQGKAVVGTTPGGQTDLIVHGETGLLVPPNDVEALANAMRLLIDDPALRERLGDAGRARARRFGADVVVPRFEQLYQRLAHQETDHTHEDNAIPLGDR
jgi:glycosyltransferase involved in cell wall biosynthesis